MGEGSNDLGSATGVRASRSKHRKQSLDRFARLFGDLEPSRIGGLPLTHDGSLANPACGADVVDLLADQIACAQLAVDGHVDQRDVAA